MSEPPAKIMKIVDECGCGQPIEYINPKNIIELLKIEYFRYDYDTDSPVNSTERHLAKTFVKKMRKYEEYFVTLCFDVFLDVLRFGNRRQLIKLEHTGRRLHLSVEKFFGEMPFLCLNLKIESNVSGYGLDVYTEGIKEICQKNLAEFPKFLRFNRVRLQYHKYHKETTFKNTIAEKCQLFANYLQLLRKVLCNSNHIFVFVRIDKNDRGEFGDHLELLDHIQKDVLSICDGSLGYEFYIQFESDQNSATNVIAKILQMPQIYRCLNVEIHLYGCELANEQLPIELISNWVNQTYNGSNKKSDERFLRIFVRTVQNARELYEHLKQTFKDAEFPVQPYRFELEFYAGNSGDNAEEIVMNKRTNEMLSINVKKPFQEKPSFFFQNGWIAFRRSGLNENLELSS